MIRRTDNMEIRITKGETGWCAEYTPHDSYDMTAHFFSDLDDMIEWMKDELL